MEIFKRNVSAVNDLSPENKQKAMDKLEDMPWSKRVNYKGFVELHFGFDKRGEMRLMDIVPIEGTILDWIRKNDPGPVF